MAKSYARRPRCVVALPRCVHDDDVTVGAAGLRRILLLLADAVVFDTATRRAILPDRFARTSHEPLTPYTKIRGQHTFNVTDNV